MEKKHIVIVILVFIAVLILSGCKSIETGRINALVEARLVNERERIRGEVAKELSQWINEDFRLLSESLGRIDTGQDATRRAAEEYRAGYLRVLDRIEQLANEGQVKE